MNNSFSEIVDSAKFLLVLLPVNPTFDQVAGGLGLYLSLRSKKDVIITSPSPILVEFNRLVGVDRITQNIGNKNLVIKFVNYEASGIDRVSYDIENGEFRLTVIPKSGFPSPKKEQIDFSYSGTLVETIILVGGENEGSFPFLSSKDFQNSRLVHIGISTFVQSMSRDLISFARPASSISEIVFTLIKESGFEMNADIATNLLLAIEQTTKAFSSQITTADTFQVVSDLLRAGGMRVTRSDARESFPPGAIPGEKIQFDKKGGPPKDWFEPKIYKGTTVS